MLLIAVPGFGQQQCDQWSYNDHGNDWGNNPTWKLCATGISQSPLDVNSLHGVGAPLDALAFDGPASTFSVKNTGNSVKVFVTSTWRLMSVTPAATLQEFHFHVPAEHLDRGQTHAAELHFVFRTQTTPQKDYAVAVWIDEGPENAAIKEVLDKKPVACLTSTTSTTTIAIMNLIKTVTHYATYSGSLTTPPCTEPVQFFITLDPITATPDQIRGLKLVVMGNARPVQWMKFR